MTSSVNNQACAAIHKGKHTSVRVMLGMVCASALRESRRCSSLAIRSYHLMVSGVFDTLELAGTHLKKTAVGSVGHFSAEIEQLNREGD